MSGIYIKNMKMPKSCCVCPVNMYLCKRGYEYLLEHPSLYDERAKDCPLVSVPPHGRLIDADALEFSPTEFWGFQAADNAKSAEAIVNDAPTIIPAEEGET